MYSKCSCNRFSIEPVSTELTTTGDLPDPPSEKIGWPWTQEAATSPCSKLSSGKCPKISIVTPSYNQGRFIEKTIRSVLLQGYPNLEYIVIDGGSTDETLEILKKYDPWIDHWVSEPDRGQSHAINKGFEYGDGDGWGGWINSDDWLAEGALQVVGGYAPTHIMSGACLIEKPDDSEVQQGDIHNLTELLDIVNVWRCGGYIPQPATFFPLSTFEALGGLNEDESYVMDYDLWCRLLRQHEIEYVDRPLAHFRSHEGQKTNDFGTVTQHLRSCAARHLEDAKVNEETRQWLQRRIEEYEYYRWRRTGRLARSGLPRPVVETIRALADMIGVSST